MIRKKEANRYNFSSPGAVGTGAGPSIVSRLRSVSRINAYETRGDSSRDSLDESRLQQDFFQGVDRRATPRLTNPLAITSLCAPCSPDKNELRHKVRRRHGQDRLFGGVS